MATVTKIISIKVTRKGGSRTIELECIGEDKSFGGDIKMQKAHWLKIAMGQHYDKLEGYDDMLVLSVSR